MSAAANLRELWEGWQSDDDSQRILDAVPKILAVLDAAEAQADDGWARVDLRAALAVLEEALS